MATVAAPSGRSREARVLAILLAGAAVAVALGVYGRVHDATGRSLVTLFFTATINLKAWFATAAFALALFQLWSAIRLPERGSTSPATVTLWPTRRRARTAGQRSMGKVKKGTVIGARVAGDDTYASSRLRV